MGFTYHCQVKVGRLHGLEGAYRQISDRYKNQETGNSPKKEETACKKKRRKLHFNPLELEK